MSRARAVVEAIARALADKPDAVSVTEREARGQTFVELTMAPGDVALRSATKVRSALTFVFTSAMVVFPPKDDRSLLR